MDIYLIDILMITNKIKNLSRHRNSLNNVQVPVLKLI